MKSIHEIEFFLKGKYFNEFLKTLETLKKCSICPRECGANRYSSELGYCNGDTSFNITSICKHHGEEPVINGKNGICNIFFSGCNLQCVYCQNFQISSNKIEGPKHSQDLKKVVHSIIKLLDEGCHAVGFVSPSHNIPHVMIIINILRKLGRNPVFVFNTGAYDKLDVLRQLEDMTDVYLPDFKYMDDSLAESLSDVTDYSEIAGKAIKEMYRQKGNRLLLNERGEAESGLIIRHLVLPGYIENSISVLRYIAEEISPEVHISLMSQYNPTINTSSHPKLKRCLAKYEYERVIDEMHRLGFHNGWIQDLDSAEIYNPDFSRDEPFK